MLYFKNTLKRENRYYELNGLSDFLLTCIRVVLLETKNVPDSLLLLSIFFYLPAENIAEEICKINTYLYREESYYYTTLKLLNNK